MKSLSFDDLQKVSEEMETLADNEQLENLIEDFGEKQPLLFTYLMTLGEEDFNEEEQELFLYLGLLAWQTARKAGMKGKISEESLSALQEENLPLLETIADAPDSFSSLWAESIEGHNQAEALSYLCDILHEEVEHGLRMRNLQSMLVFLKVAMDAMDAK